MITWQDLQAVGENETDRMNFIRSTIMGYMSGPDYSMAKAAWKYMRRENPDIRNFAKIIYSADGRKIQDTYSSDYRIGRAFFPYFVTQQVQYLLSNGISWANEDTPERLGTDDAPIDTTTAQVVEAALWGAQSYGFWNMDHVDVFNALEFCPLFDEENGLLRAGIRWWQIDAAKPLRATLYEEDGYTDYIWGRRKDNGQEVEDGKVLHEKRAYKISVSTVPVDGEQISNGTNYPTFPIVPMWANQEHISELAGLREQIFTYDVICSGFVNNVEDASHVYWAIHNAPAMIESDLVKFLEGVRRIHVAVTEDAGSKAEPHQIETPYQARAVLLDRLEKDIYRDAMAFDPALVASGAATATEIKAAYTNLRLKTNKLEYQVITYLNKIMRLAGVNDTPTFTRDELINEQEMISAILNASQVLSQDYVTRKIMTLLGDGDQVNSVLEQMAADETTRWQEMGTMIDE